MRFELKLLRVKKGLTQKEMADKIGCERATYVAIENGTRNGSYLFWTAFKRAFDIDSLEMWEFIQNYEQKIYIDKSKKR